MKYNWMLFVLLLCSCSKHRQTEKEMFTVIDSLQVVSEFIPQKEILKPEAIVWTNDSLIILQSSQDTAFFHLFDYNGLFIRSFIRFGEGPGEMISPLDYQIQGDSILEIFDMDRSTLFAYQLRDIIEQPNPVSFANYPVSVSASRAVRCGDSCFYYLGATDKMYGYQAFGVDTSYIDYPIEYQNYSPDFKHLLFQGHIKKSPVANRLVCAAMRFGYLQVLSFEADGRLLSLKDCFLEAPRFIDSSQGNMTSVTLSKENSSGFNAVAVTSQHIYALYSGRKSSDARSYFANRVYVFDWEGNPVRQLILPKDAWSIYVNEKENRLYSVSYGEEDEEMKAHYYVYNLGE